MPAAALEAEVAAYVAGYVDQRDGGHGGWWCVTATLRGASCSPRRAR
jgi:hypothetical protein